MPLSAYYRTRSIAEKKNPGVQEARGHLRRFREEKGKWSKQLYFGISAGNIRRPRFGFRTYRECGLREALFSARR